MRLRGRGDHPDVQAAVARAEGFVLDCSAVVGDVATTANRALVIGFDGSLLQSGVASLRAPGPMIAAKGRCSGSHGLLWTGGFLASPVED